MEIHRFDPVSLELTTDRVLEAQGADPAVVRARRPQSAEIAEDALRVGLGLLEPCALMAVLDVETLSHRRLTLRDGGWLQGDAIGQHLAGARQVAVTIFTAGAALEQRIMQEISRNLPLAFALDALGTVACDALTQQVVDHIYRLAAQQGWGTSIFLSPGMSGWSVGQGQPQIFRLIDATRIGVRLNSQRMVVPRKSVSGVIGLGPGLASGGSSPCEYCTLADTCQFKHRLAQLT